MTNEPTQLTRKEREEAFRRNLVLDAAEQLFAEKGFEGTTVAEIAERAELAKGSLYQLFGSKEELIAAAIRRKVDEVWAALDEILSRPVSPAEVIRAIIRVKLKTVWRSRHFARIFLHELRGFQWCMDSPQLNAYRRDVETLERRIKEVFAEGQKTGEFRSDIPPTYLFAAMAGFSNAAIHSWLQEGDELDLEAALNHAVELFFHGVSPRDGSD